MHARAGRSALLLLHIWWPLLLGGSLVLVVRRATERSWNPVGVAVLLLGIGAAYSLDRIVDAPRTLPRAVRGALTAAVAGASLAAAWLTLALPLETAVLVPVMGGVAVSYPWAKRIPLGKTLFVPLIWIWSAIALPFNDGSWFGWHWLLEPVAVPLALLMTAGCLLCDLKDETHDRLSGVPSMPALLGARAATRLAVGLALAAGIIAGAEGRIGVACSAAVLGGAAAWPELLAVEVIGPLIVDVILTLPGLLIVAHLI